jgi:hypothetical protein
LSLTGLTGGRTVATLDYRSRDAYSSAALVKSIVLQSIYTGNAPTQLAYCVLHNGGQWTVDSCDE